MEQNKNQNEAKEQKKVAIDDQTGIPFEIHPEKWWDTLAATISILYSIAMLVFLSWLLIDFYTGNKSLIGDIFKDPAVRENALFRLIALTVIGGGLGGVINGIRSFIGWHCERKAFGWRFVWKDISLPLLGAILAVIVYAIIKGGIAVFGGGINISDASKVQEFSAFAVGSLAGYGSHKVFKWLDAQVDKLFKIQPIAETTVPNLTEKTQEEAEALLKQANLKLGKVGRKTVEEHGKVNKVIAQNPQPDSPVSAGSAIDVTIGTKA